MGIETADALLEAVLSEEPLPKNRLTAAQYAQFLTNCQQEAIRQGEWAGMPVPVYDHKLVLEPRYPFQGLHGMRLDSDGEIVEEPRVLAKPTPEEPERQGLAEALATVVAEAVDTAAAAAGVATERGLTGEQLVPMDRASLIAYFTQSDSSSLEAFRRHIAASTLREINSWYSYSKGGTVTVWDEAGKRSVSFDHDDAYKLAQQRLGFAISTMCVGAYAWSLEAELAAQAKLQQLLDPLMYKTYILTGAFAEESQLSKVIYMFRRCRPTIAFSGGIFSGTRRILACLCLHPAGLYYQTFAGVLVPTDDVIAHLLMMRGDEKRFWKKANHHPIHLANAGL